MDDAEIHHRGSRTPLERNEPLVERARAARIPWGEGYEFAGASTDGAITLLNVSRRDTFPASAERLGFDLEQTDAVQGIDTRSGKVVWERKAEPTRRGPSGSWPLMLRAMATADNLAALYTPERLVIVDARTGKELSTADERRTALAGADPDPSVVFSHDQKLVVLHPVSGNEHRFPFGTQFLISVDRVGERIIADVDSDSGSNGGSINPKFLVAFDLSGKQRWRFPLAADYARESDGAHRPPDVTQLYAVPDAGLVIGGNPGGLYGLRASDGRKLWHHPFPGTPLDPVSDVYGHYLLLATDPKEWDRGYWDRHSLAAIDAKTGAVRWLARIPRMGALLARQQTLYLGASPTHLPAPGAVIAYRLADFGIH